MKQCLLRLSAASALTLAFGSAPSFGASNFSITVDELAINRLADHFPLPKFTGEVPLPGAKLLWEESVQSINVRVLTSGLRLEGKLKTRFAVQFGSTAPKDSDYLVNLQDFIANASVGFVGNSLRFKVDQTVTLPVKVNVPVFGVITLADFKTSFPGMKIDYPVPTLPAPGNKVRRPIGARAQSLVREYGDGYVKLSATIRCW